MLKENNDKLGCCFSTYEEDIYGTLWYTHLVVCNYNEVIYLKSPVYTKGASNCSDLGDDYVIDKTYPNLCVKSQGNITTNDNYYEADEFTEMALNLSTYCEIELEKCDDRKHIGCEIDPGLEVSHFSSIIWFQLTI